MNLPDADDPNMGKCDQCGGAATLPSPDEPIDQLRLCDACFKAIRDYEEEILAAVSRQERT